jgi:cytokinesis protein
MKDARRKAEQLQLYLDEMVKTYDDIMVFYGEDNADENARRDFFAKLSAFLVEWKKSREKNTALEESRKRTEASLARKRINVNLANNATPTETANSPATSGAMDSLLEKLRAAAPQAKDQRDRRRRARLKERHQVRVASGQKPPSDINDGEEEDGAEKPADGEGRADENGHLSPPINEADDGKQEAQVSEGEDVADRAASMLLGLRSNSDAGGGERQRRRRESADEERRNRRMRRRNPATSGSKDSADGGLPTVQEPASPTQTESAITDDPPASPPDSQPPPSIVVSEQDETLSQDPPSEGSSPRKPTDLSD